MTKRYYLLSAVLVLVVLMASARGKRVLFIGDSITDGAWGNSKVWNTPSDERNQKDMNHIYGHGYMMICASYYQGMFPTEDFTFWNRGISGNTLADLHSRWQKDAIDLQPDIISILIGTNDADKALKAKSAFDIKQWEQSYRELLDSTTAALPNVKFVLCTPFVAETGKLKGTATYAQRQQIVTDMDNTVRRIANDYHAVMVPFDELIASLVASPSPSETYWIWDGIHPTPAAHYRMAQLWLEKNKNTLNINQD